MNAYSVILFSQLQLCKLTVVLAVYIETKYAQRLLQFLYAVKVRRHTSWSRGPLSWIPGMLVHCFVNFVVNFIRDGTVFA